MIDSIGTDLNPTDGILSIPKLGFNYAHISGMSLRAVLSENLKALMAANPSLATFPLIVAATAKRLSNGTLQRIRTGSHATSLDKLEDLSAVFEVTPSQLLTPALKVVPNKLTGKPQIATPFWPFHFVSEVNYQQLTAEQQGVVQERANALIEQMLTTQEKSTSYKGNHSNSEMNVPQTSKSISSERSEQLKKLGIFDVTPKGQNERSKPQKAREPRTN